MLKSRISRIAALASVGVVAGYASYATAAGKYYHEIQVVEHAAMLVERMAKDAALIVLHIDEGNGRKEMQAAREEFARILNGLQNGDQGLQLDGNYREEVLQKDLAEVVRIWPTIDQEVGEVLASSESFSRASRSAKGGYWLSS